jgi:hypothetical protein
MCVFPHAYIHADETDDFDNTCVLVDNVESDANANNNLFRVGRTLHTVPSGQTITRGSRKYLTINMINMYNKPMVVHKSQIIGKVSRVDSRDIRQKEEDDKQHSAEIIETLRQEVQEKIYDDEAKHTAMITQSDRHAIWQAIEPYLHVFDTREYGEARDISGHTIEHTIDTSDAKPSNSRAYRQAPAMANIINETIERLLKTGAIRPSNSPWASPIVLVKKPGINKWRMCIDYRAVNEVTQPDVYPIPPIDTLLYSMQGAKVFTTLDLQDAYHQIKVAEQDIPKTAFIHNYGLYEYLLMPFGLRNAPATFQRYVNAMLGVLRQKIENDDLFTETERSLNTFKHLLGYLDDIICFSADIESHAKHLSVLFKLLSLHGLKVKLSKCDIASKQVKYLGHIIDGSGIRVDNDKVKAIQSMPLPKNITDIQSYLGMCGYYRRFIPRYTEKAQPMYELLSKKKTWDWTEQCTESHRQLKEALMTAPILAMPDFNKMFIVQTDASYVGIGAVLSQQHTYEGELVDQPVCYVSRSLRKAEKNYAAYEIELLALVYAIKQYRQFIMGSKFIVQTDHRALQWLKKSRDLSGRLARWALLLQEYDFEVVYRKGKDNANADCLSRLPLPDDNDSDSLSETTLELDQMSIKLIDTSMVTEPLDPTNYFIRMLSYTCLTPEEDMCMGVRDARDKEDLHLLLPITRAQQAEETQHDAEIASRVPSQPTIPILAPVPIEDTELEEGEVKLLEEGEVELTDMDYKHINMNNNSPDNNPWANVTDDIEVKDKDYYYNIDNKTFGLLQSQDSWWIDIYHYVLDGTIPERYTRSQMRKLIHICDKYVIIDDVLRHIYFTKDKIDNTIVLQICVLQTDVPHLLEQLHTHPVGGHLSISKVFDKFINRYFMPSMYQTIEKYCNACQICIRRHTPKHLSAYPMLTPQVDNFKNYGACEGIAIDVIGPVITSTNKTSLMLTVVDTYTRYGEVYPLRRQTTKEIVQTLITNWICRYGMPKSILSDNGRAFVASIYRACLRHMGVSVRHITPYRPEANGICERLNGTIINMLRAYVHTDHSKWVMYLPYVMFAYNTSRHPHTNYTPYFLMHGHEANIGSNVLLDGESTNTLDKVEYIKDMLSNFHQAHSNIQDRVAQSATERQEANLKIAKTLKAYDIGQHVYVYMKPMSSKKKGLSKKFMLLYHGPYKIVRQLNAVTYVCQLLSNPKKKVKAHFTQLKSADGSGPKLVQPVDNAV